LRFKDELEKIALHIYSRDWYRRAFVNIGRQKEYLKQLNPGEHPEKLLEAYHCRKIREMTAGIIGCVLILIAGIIWYVCQQESLVVSWVQRPAYYEGDQEDTWEVYRSDGTKTDISLNISEQEFTKEEADANLQAAMEYLDEHILGDNESFDRIEYSLFLPMEIENTGISIQWFSDQSDVLSSAGEISADFMDDEGRLVQLKGLLACQRYEAVYIRALHVFPMKRGSDEAFFADVLEQLKLAEVQSREKEGFALPGEVDGEKIEFRKKGGYEILILGVLGFVVLLLLYVNRDEKLGQEAKKRNLQLLADYPELVSKLTVLMQAGLPARAAFVRISADYVKRKNRYGAYRYAYEELLIMCHEMDNGVSEEKAYEHFGKRCGILPYMRLGGLLSQNLRRGSRRLLEKLNEESRDSFEERKRFAKKAGEEAGTKMLVPMVLMLAVTILVILYPAFISFRL